MTPTYHLFCLIHGACLASIILYMHLQTFAKKMTVVLLCICINFSSQFDLDALLTTEIVMVSITRDPTSAMRLTPKMERIKLFVQVDLLFTKVSYGHLRRRSGERG